MITVLLLIFLVTSLLVLTARKPKNFPPGPPCIPILGSTPFIKIDNIHFAMERMREKYGPVIGVKFGHKNVVMVCGKKEVDEVLKRDEFQGRPIFRKGAEGVMFSEGDFWVQQRRFSLRHLRDFGFGSSSIVDVILGEVEDFFQNYLETRRPVQVSGLFNASTTNVLWAMMGGQRYSHDDPEFKMLLNFVQERFRNGTAAGSFSNRFPILAKLLPFLKVVRQEKETEMMLNNFLEKAFKEHRLTKGPQPRDFIDAYVSELDSNRNLHPSFSELTLRNVCTEYFSAGAESVGNSLGFHLLYCVLYPEWQEEIYNEIVSVLDKEGRPSLDDKKRLHKVQAFMAEVSRSNTIASVTVPHKCLTETNLSGYTIPRDTMIIISLYSVLQDNSRWGDPKTFRPERHLDSNGVFIKDKEWLPVFGAGKRVCPGESFATNVMFLFFTSMIQRYKFSLPKGKPAPSTVCMSGFTQAPQPFEVLVTKR